MLKTVLILAFSIFTFVNATVVSESYFAHPAYPGKCFIQNTILSPGQRMRHPLIECAQITCDNVDGLATIETCSAVEALGSPISHLKGYDLSHPPSCAWGDFVDTKGSYPECCRRHYNCVY